MENMDEQERAQFKDMAKAYCKAAGIDIDFEKVDFTTGSDDSFNEEFEKKIHEAREKKSGKTRVSEP